MKICAYVQEAYAKANYKVECLDTRQFVGLRVIIDCLQRAGYEVDYAGIATVHQYDIVLVSLTSDCDWWSYITERLRWRPGDYKVIIGGAGVLHVTPFLRWGDYFMLGRGEDTIAPLVRCIERGELPEDDSIICAETFSVDNTYLIKQAESAYPHPVGAWVEDMIGCNHKCLFCVYTWTRRCNFNGAFRWDASGNSTRMSEKECAMLDYESGAYKVDFAHLRTTAIDGFSERLRYSVGKRISDACVRRFLADMVLSDAKPHQIKFFNICGLPGESLDDWQQLLDNYRSTDVLTNTYGKQWSIVLHSTPFRPMPATPMACAPASKRNYRGEIGATLGKGLKGNLIYQGRSLWSVESMGTESLPTVMLSMIAHRGSEDDSDNIARLCSTPKFWRASCAQREATLAATFDMERLFGEFTAATLPSRYLRTYCKVEKMWPHGQYEAA